MVKTKESQGLCSTCNKNNACSHAKDTEQPVLQCEEFDGYAADPARAKGKTTIGEKDSGKYKGLCANCGIRETCTYPKPEGGVWHCEEYR